MRRKFSKIVIVAGLVAALAPLQAPSSANAVASGEQVAVGTMLSPPANLSTSGDFATDTFGDPWDFSNDQDVIPVPGVGAFTSDAASVANGQLTVATRNLAEIRFLMNWSQTQPILPWGHDGWKHPIDANKYNQLDFKIRSAATMEILIRFWTASGEFGALRFTAVGGQWQTMHFDLTDRANYPYAGAQAVWGGQVVRFELHRGVVPGNPAVNVDLDYLRIHRPDASREPTPALAVPQVITPSSSTGADYATTEMGNPWDFHGLDDVSEQNDVANLAINADGDLTGVTTGNDPFIGLPLGPTLNTDRYHHLTIDVCFAGGFSLEDEPGGGMVGRLIWIPHGTLNWVSSQAFLVFPGCHSIDIDLVTNPPGAVDDPSINPTTGWRGVRIDRLRFDLNEDRGMRAFTLKNISLTDDNGLSSVAPIQFRDAAGTPGARADIYATTAEGGYAGVRIANNLAVGPDVNTFNWNGTDDTGAALPNGSYWIYVVIRNAAGSAVGYSTGPMRIQKPVPTAPSYFVPLTPTRVLDTREGIGGNVFPLVEDTLTEVRVAGVGGVPLAGLTAVVMNVTVTDTTSAGFITAWPSGEPRPLVSNLNFAPQQTVANLVTVKVGVNGRVNLYNSAGRSNLIADVAGYYTTVPPAAGGRFNALTPARVLDTRSGTGVGSSGPLTLNQIIDLGVTGVGGVPAAGVTAVALNVTVDQPTGLGYLTVWPNGEPRPTASTINFAPGQTIANLVLAKVGGNGRVSIFNSSGETHVVADVIGYFSSTGGLFVPVPPQRLVDTRDGTGGSGGALGHAETRTLLMANGNPVPASANAVVVNVTSADSSVPSFVTVWPSGSTMPVASTMNPNPLTAVPNQAYLRLGAGGKLDVYNSSGSTNLVVDVFGYITAG